MTSDVESTLNLPVIGDITEIADDAGSATYVSKEPDSILAENFRLCAQILSFFQIRKPIKTELITSPSLCNGRTIKLALSIAQGEQEVVLVEADLRRPIMFNKLSAHAAHSYGPYQYQALDSPKC